MKAGNAQYPFDSEGIKGYNTYSLLFLRKKVLKYGKILPAVKKNYRRYGDRDLKGNTWHQWCGKSGVCGRKNQDSDFDRGKEIFLELYKKRVIVKWNIKLKIYLIIIIIIYIIY